METNQLPLYDTSDNTTGCCPRFKPKAWDEQQLHFKDKLFAKATTRSIMHVPLNFGSMFKKTIADMEKADAFRADGFLVLSCDPSAWRGEHLFAAARDVPGREMVKLTGDYLTKVFEGPYKNIPTWMKEMTAFVREQGKAAKKIYFFYTTCPKCAKTYGKNCIVAIAEV